MTVDFLCKCHARIEGLKINDRRYLSPSHRQVLTIAEITGSPVWARESPDKPARYMDARIFDKDKPPRRAND